MHFDFRRKSFQIFKELMDREKFCLVVIAKGEKLVEEKKKLNKFPQIIPSLFLATRFLGQHWCWTNFSKSHRVFCSISESI
jgi:hypothetical protein